MPAVRRLVDEAIDGAIGHGVPPPAFLQLVIEQVRARQQTPRRVAVVGDQEASLDERVVCVAQALDGIGVDVLGLSFEQLEASDGARPTIELADITWFLVPVDETRRATELLGPHARRIVPMTRAVKPEVRDFIAAQPDSTRFGIIAGSDDLIGRILSMLGRLHPLRVPPLTTSIEHPSDVARVMRDADALIVGVLATPHIGHRLPPGKPCIELTSMPDERTLRRLRALVAAAD
jgi:hypothetical protein